ncbi:MAG: TonB-dependent receptor, partial [Gemmatimonadetes bacterium]|nr:TonB-dependent receptor [Gemmatimonadota bacterium]
MKRAITWVATVAAMAVLIDASSAQNAPLVEFNGRKVPESVLAVISVDLEDMPFEEVLADIAAKGNFELNYNRSRIPVKEKLTVRMENMRALDILIHVMKKTGTELVVTREGRLAVVPAEEQSDQRSRKKSTLSGFVRDHSDGESLPNATVAVAFESQKRMGALSNAEGYYAITSIPSGICMVTVSYIGYATYRDTLWLAAGQDLRRDIELEREALQMEGVVVEAKADRVEHEMRKQPSMVSLQIKSLKQMPAMGETDLLRGLQLLPGVQTASDFSSGLYVRGGGPDQTGIMLDQIRLYNPSHAFGFFSTFNPDAIKDVTFYKGAYPAQYGGSLGAVLDVQNRDGNRREFNASGGVSLISSRL